MNNSSSSYSSSITKRSKNFGKCGLIHLSDLVIHKIEFYAWLKDIKNKTKEDLNYSNERKYFEEFISLYNNGNLPHKKYYDLIKYTKKENDILLKRKRKFQKPLTSQQDSGFIFDDEGKKAKEKKLLREMEQQKKLDEAIYAMNREKAEAMREIEIQENLMRYYYQTSNIDAAKEIHKQVFGTKKENENIPKIEYEPDEGQE